MAVLRMGENDLYVMRYVGGWVIRMYERYEYNSLIYNDKCACDRVIVLNIIIHNHIDDIL